MNQIDRLKSHIAAWLDRTSRWLRSGDTAEQAALRTECISMSRRAVAVKIGVSSKQIAAFLDGRPCHNERKIVDWTTSMLVVPERQITTAMIHNALIAQTAALRRAERRAAAQPTLDTYDKL